MDLTSSVIAIAHSGLGSSGRIQLASGCVGNNNTWYWKLLLVKIKSIGAEYVLRKTQIRTQQWLLTTNRQLSYWLTVLILSGLQRNCVALFTEKENTFVIVMETHSIEYRRGLKWIYSIWSVSSSPKMKNSQQSHNLSIPALILYLLGLISTKNRTWTLW